MSQLKITFPPKSDVDVFYFKKIKLPHVLKCEGFVITGTHVTQRIVGYCKSMVTPYVSEILGKERNRQSNNQWVKPGYRCFNFLRVVLNVLAFIAS